MNTNMEISAISEVKANGIVMEQKMGGDWRLVINSGTGRSAVILDDSACEDYYDEETAESSFVAYLNEDNLVHCLVIAAALDECWDGYDSKAELWENYEAAYDYLLANMEVKYEDGCFSGSYSNGNINYKNLTSSGEFGPVEYLLWDDDKMAYEKADKFTANYAVLDQVVYCDYDRERKAFYVENVAFVDSWSY